MVYARTCEVCLNTRKDCLECGGRGTVERDQCPMAECDEESRRVVRMFAFAQAGNLPADGGVSSQSAKLIRAMDLVAMERNAIEERERARAEALQAAGTRR